MSDDLVTWLRVQLDAEEQAALDAMWSGDERWTTYEFQHAHDTWNVDDSYDEGVATIRAQAADSESVARHIVRQQPLNLIADIAGKRRVIARYEAAEKLRADDEWDAANGGVAAGLRLAVLDLAAVYADRPGYRAEWAPVDL